MSLLLSAPQPLVASNIISEFDGGEASVDDRLKRRDMPDPIPVLILAHLAVDRRAQGINWARVYCRMLLIVRDRSHKTRELEPWSCMR